MSEVALTRGTNRTENLQLVLKLLQPKIAKSLKALKKDDYILIKPNLVTAKNSQACTQLESMETLLTFLRSTYQGKIIVGEGTSIGSTQEAFRNYNYTSLENKYQVELIDLNHDEGVLVDAYDRNLKPIKALVAKTVLDAPYSISFSPIKTHNSVILSLSIENMVTGSLLKGNIKNRAGYRNLFRRNFQDYKTMISQNYTSHNLSIASILPKIMPDLAIIDGFTAIERNGPVGGQVVETGLALASTNPVACDALTAYLTGFDPGKIGYLHHLDIAKIEIKTIGKKISECRTKLRPPDTLQDQLKWYNAKRK